MAYTVSHLVKTVFGTERVGMIRVTADAASGAVTTGMGVVDFVNVSCQSCSTAGFRTFMNQAADLSASNGSVAISGVASGDVIYLTVYGH